MRFLIILTFLAAACSGDDDSMPMIETDAGGEQDTSTGEDQDAAGPEYPCEYPGPPYMTGEGRTFEPFTLNQCDGTSYDFVNQEFCDSSMTVISIAAGWCQPCIIESTQLTEQITERFRDDGVRVIQILVQNEMFLEPTPEFCVNWVERFGLTNIELLDPAQLTNIYFPSDSLPATIIVDREGIIRFRENGATEGLISLRTKIEQLLAEQQ